MNEIEPKNWNMELAAAFLRSEEAFLKMLDFAFKTYEGAANYYKENEKWLREVGIHDEVVELFKEKFKKEE